MRTRIVTPQAPAAIGPYSQGIRANGFVYTAGQLGLDPATGAFAANDIAGQTRQALTNIKAILEAAGSGMEKVVKTTVYMVYLGDFKIMNGVYAEFFGNEPPARSTVEVSALPLGGLVEIEAVALLE